MFNAPLIFHTDLLKVELSEAGKVELISNECSVSIVMSSVLVVNVMIYCFQYQTKIPSLLIFSSYPTVYHHV